MQYFVVIGEGPQLLHMVGWGVIFPTVDSQHCGCFMHRQCHTIKLFGLRHLLRSGMSFYVTEFTDEYPCFIRNRSLNGVSCTVFNSKNTYCELDIGN